jgi:hypothetical protein
LIAQRRFRRWLIGWAIACVLMLTPLGAALALVLMLGPLLLAAMAFGPAAVDWLPTTLSIICLGMAFVTGLAGAKRARDENWHDAYNWWTFALCWAALPMTAVLSVYSLSYWWSVAIRAD